MDARSGWLDGELVAWVQLRERERAASRVGDAFDCDSTRANLADLSKTQKAPACVLSR